MPLLLLLAAREVGVAAEAGGCSKVLVPPGVIMASMAATADGVGGQRLTHAPAAEEKQQPAPVGPRNMSRSFAAMFPARGGLKVDKHEGPTG